MYTAVPLNDLHEDRGSFIRRYDLFKILNTLRNEPNVGKERFKGFAKPLAVC